MLIGLLFIFAFGLVLSELYGPEPEPTTASVTRNESPDFRPIQENQRPGHVDRIVRRRRPRRSGPAPSASGADSENPAPQYVMYTIRSGDTLTSIARRLLGDGSRQAVRRIYQANVDRLPNPDRLVIGTRIRIPRN
jgi:nucleoid-associated protein YgaU